MATTLHTAEQIPITSIADRVEIAPGVEMPRLGLGTSHAWGGDVRREVRMGLELGYRLIDTAANYVNEQEIGEEIAASGVPRYEVFITTKLEEPDQGYRSTFMALEASLQRLGTDYVDLYLIHFPVNALTNETWRAMEELVRQEKVRAIGVSNFEEKDLRQIYTTAKHPPAVNQFELHPWRQRPELQHFCRQQRITVQAWAPVMRGHAEEAPELVEIGQRYDKTAAQVSIRWILQKGLTTIPKSIHEDRLREDADVFDFELTLEEMRTIDGLDRGQHVR